ncbi:hypothetical protein FIBSPDRAFT_962461 [Athelia psychrophila]|uniref:N-acetyltransferase domain-containing protein n=1 Tax=Athelia psychrophila TaxID=1759441 RepID=A0A166A525_9AGAM|nr:hypothetical protein FIBSPDRAFT_962461 [Fibularhizoctonia sp. CBS 109695]
MKNPFQSARLSYRALESTDTGFIYSLITDTDAFANSAPFLLRPVTRQLSEGMQKSRSEVLLGVVGILSPAKAAESSEAAHDIDGTGTPIGALFISQPSPANQHHHNADLGIDIIACYQRKGYVS